MHDGGDDDRNASRGLFFQIAGNLIEHKAQRLCSLFHFYFRFSAYRSVSAQRAGGGTYPDSRNARDIFYRCHNFISNFLLG